MRNSSKELASTLSICGGEKIRRREKGSKELLYMYMYILSKVLILFYH